MPHRLEIALKPELFDAEGEGVRQKAQNYFGFQIDEVRTVNIIIIDAGLSSVQLKSKNGGPYHYQELIPRNGH